MPDEQQIAAIQQRDSGDVLHQYTAEGGVDAGDYAAAHAKQWGGPASPRWFEPALRQYPISHAEQRGRRALVTGGSGGIGFFVAKLLAAIGLVVVLPARPGLEFETLGAAAAIRTALPAAVVEVPEVPLDLRSFASVRAFGAHMRARGEVIDVLCLNAARSGGVRDPREVTTDGLEIVMQVNLLSHTLLVHELLPNLRASSYARIAVHTDSARTNAPQSNLDDLDGQRYSGSPWLQYALSKAGLCLLARALNKRLSAAGVRGAAVVADSGLSATGLNFQHDLAVTLGLGRRGISNTRAFHDSHAAHAADAALPLVMACLVGEANEFWVGELVGPRATSLDSAAHRTGYLLWAALRAGDPMDWPDDAVEKLWQRVAELISVDGNRRRYAELRDEL